MLAYVLHICLSLGVVLRLVFDIDNSVEYIIEYILFNIYDVKVMTDQISGLVGQFPEDASLHPVMSCTKSLKLLLIKFNAKQDFIQLGYPLKYFYTIEKLECMVLLYLISSEIIPLHSKRMMLGEELMMTIELTGFMIMFKLK